MSCIETNLHLQAMRCSVCLEVYEIPRRVLHDPEGVLNMVEELKDDHRECAANPGNLKLAIANRMFRKRYEQETAKAAARKAA